ncbi:EAL and modified HD-GYP domain-containing signal transduction protein [Halobacillus dabanensis]|uniref:EAL and modified HD-GYP domain-containing signal transduction protein n=1 Tax=Halobacillus dabanensis TaxID=240302 RepID=A0A1I3Z920_HALDA|nr:HDOD domain-containing protein [Halobacillus dabanensis]SFK40116.1 EAL and modified HD-GYP domain-containing signal transduction protein [Halobacillus dabanensis]
MEVFVARQPILTVENDVYGYELLYRNSEENRFVPMDGSQATSEVLMNSFFTIGLDRLSENKPCFINFTEDLLLEKVPEYFNPDQLFVEILEHVSFSMDIIKVCRELKEKGYRIALDDIINIDQPSLFELLPYVHILKVDIRSVTDENRKKIIQLAEEYDLRLLAEKVETNEEHQRCVAEGFSLFQGFYFSKPVIVKGLDIPFFSSTYFQMIKELSLSEDEINIEKMTGLLEQDIGLTYKLLRLINSSQRRTKVPIRSIKQAVVLLGPESLKKWLYVLSIEQTSTIRTPQSQLVIKTSLVRAKMCEQIAVRIRAKEKSDGYFLTGFLSLVDVMVQRPVNEVIESLPLDEGIKQCMQGCKNAYRKVLDLAIRMEKADFEGLESILKNDHLSFTEVFEIYGQAIAWTEKLYQDHFKVKVKG